MNCIALSATEYILMSGNLTSSQQQFSFAWKNEDHAMR